MASEKMQGRGYVQNGLEKAAGYIHHQFDSLGLKPFGKDFCQKFKMSVNTFPSNPTLRVDNKELEVGKDFQPDPNSGSGNGIFEPIVFSRRTIGDIPEVGRLNIPGKKLILVLDDFGIEDKDSLAYFRSLKYAHSRHLPVIYLIDEKLTWSVASEASPFPIVEVLRENFDEDSRKIELNVRSKMENEFEAMNMMAFIKGKVEPDTFLVFTAHYDHLGMIGSDACFYGANDNASGCAYLLELARHYSKMNNKYSMVFIAFAGEEAGLIGSKYYVENPLFPLDKIKFLLNIDLMGFGEEGLTVVNGTLFPSEFETLTAINTDQELLQKIKLRGPAANSDHYWFTQKGVPAFFIYTLGGNTAYHDVFDRYENLTFAEFRDLFKLITTFISTFE